MKRAVIIVLIVTATVMRSSTETNSEGNSVLLLYRNIINIVAVDFHLSNIMLFCCDLRIGINPISSQKSNDQKNNTGLESATNKTRSSECPKGESWYDGCNWCFCNENGRSGCTFAFVLLFLLQRTVQKRPSFPKRRWWTLPKLLWINKRALIICCFNYGGTSSTLGSQD